MTKEYIYDSFGNATSGGSDTFSNEFQFTGAVADGGVYYMNSRYYNANTGRFLTQDTYSGNAYEPWTQHLYTYCGNNPVNMIDPTGHYSQQVPGGYIETTTGQFYSSSIHMPELMDIEVGNVPRYFKTVLADLNDPELERKACMDLIDNNGYFSESIAKMLPPLVVDFAELSYRNRTPVEMIDVAYWKKIQDEREACMLGVTTVAAVEANVSSSLSGGVGKCSGADYYQGGFNTSINTPYGKAIQSNSSAALAARDYVNNGGTLYRGGKFGVSNTSDAQFWATESPLSPGYANKYGVAYGDMDYVITANLKPGASFITRPAPGLGGNAGGGIEIVVNPGSVNIATFIMP